MDVHDDHASGHFEEGYFGARNVFVVSITGRFGRANSRPS